MSKQQASKAVSVGDLSCLLGERGCHFIGLTPEKLQDSGLLSSSRLPSNAPSPVVKLPREPLPFFRMSGSLGSSHSMVGPAEDGECTVAGSVVLMVLPPPPPSQGCPTLTASDSLSPLHTLTHMHIHTCSSTLCLPVATQLRTNAWLLTGQMNTPQTAALDQE